MAELVEAFSLLKIANSPVLSQFLHDCVDDLIGSKQTNFDSYNSDIEWTVDDFNKAKRSIQNFYRENFDKETLPDLSADLGLKIKQEIENCFMLRRDDIYETMVKEKLVKNGHNLVESLDWKLKWVLGSSKLSSIREPLLQMDLLCLKQNSEGDGMQRNIINFEMDLSTLREFIEQLEKVNKELKSTQ